jgi:hypothetical protein
MKTIAAVVLVVAGTVAACYAIGCSIFAALWKGK